MRQIEEKRLSEEWRGCPNDRNSFNTIANVFIIFKFWQTFLTKIRRRSVF
jgi:hypothetical protein